MYRLTFVFVVWMASTAHAVDEPVYIAGADEDRRALLEKAQLAWTQYRLANCAAYGRWGDECLAYMAEERAAELRNIAFPDEEDPGCGDEDRQGD
jgi:hypothetical protein